MRKFFLAIIYLSVFLNLSFIGSVNMKDSVPAGENPHTRTRNHIFDTIRTDLSQYVWPTDASYKITSSFAEYRSTHFHAGIDISTNRQTGYKVFAVRDGYVHRIRIMPNGYGKMLFIKHDDGYVSAYAHLKEFNDAINEIAETEQYRRGTFGIDLTLDSARLSVRRNEVIAYTGDTGFGPPHLHFELRDENMNPLNPLLSDNFNINDNIPPVIRRIVISPLGYNSTVNNSASPLYLSRFQKTGGALKLPQTIRLHGQVGFGVDADDKTDGTWSQTGIHRMEFYIDDSLTYSMELNRVPAEETKEILIHYDLPSIAKGKGKFQKLYIEEGNSLPFYEKKPVFSGVINTEDLSEGRHRFKIVCMDIRRNKTELNGSIFANHTPLFQILDYSGSKITIGGPDIGSAAKFYLYGKRAYQPDWSQHTLTEGRFEIVNNEIKLPVNTRPYDVLKIIAETKWGSRSVPMFYFLKKPFGPANKIEIGTEILESYVRFTITTGGVFSGPPELFVTEGNTERPVHLDAIDINAYTGAFTPSTSHFGERFARVSAEVNGVKASTDDKFSVYPVSPDRSGSFSINEGEITVSFDSGAVYRPLCLQIEKKTAIYTFKPPDVLLDGGLVITMPIEGSKDESGWGLYFRGFGGWIFQTGSAGRKEAVLTTRIKQTLGDIALMRDVTPPAVGRLRTQVLNGKISLNFSYKDDLSGVDTDEIKLYIDNELFIPEIDGENRRVWFKSKEQFNRGKHSLKITMKDRARNGMDLSRTVTVR